MDDDCGLSDAELRVKYADYSRRMSRARGLGIAPTVKCAVRMRDGESCAYCDTRNKARYRVNKVVPFSLGGKRTPDNLVVACYECANSKSGMRLTAWLEKIKHPDPQSVLDRVKARTSKPVNYILAKAESERLSERYRATGFGKNKNLRKMMSADE